MVFFFLFFLFPFVPSDKPRVASLILNQDTFLDFDHYRFRGQSRRNMLTAGSQMNIINESIKLSRYDRADILRSPETVDIALDDAGQVFVFATTPLEHHIAKAPEKWPSSRGTEWQTATPTTQCRPKPG